MPSLLLTVFASVLLTGNALRSISNWEELFNCRAEKIFTSDSELDDTLRSYTASISREYKHPYVLKYTSGCEKSCHDEVMTFIRHRDMSHYGIVNTNHAVLYADKDTMETLARHFTETVVDYSPVLPQLKVDKALHDTNICEREAEITLHVSFFAISFEELEFVKKKINSWLTNNLQSHDFKVFHSNNESEKQSMIAVSVECIRLWDAVNFFSSLSEVQWVEHRPAMTVHSKWANSVLQSGLGSYSTIHAANLTGTGEIIGIADTGIDPYSCFFFDPNTPFPYDTVNYNHRKVVYYDTYVDNEDGASHGTTVSGVAAGKCSRSDGYEAYNGAAFNGKIAFFDIGYSNGALVIPPNVDTDLFSPLYNVGARVQSMSWGSSSSTYTTDARNLDVFMWDHSDAIVFVAGGNSGEDGSYTVGSPGTCKSGLTAGASLNAGRSWNAYDLSGRNFNQKSLAGFSSKGPTSDGRLKPDVCGVGYYISNAAEQYPYTGESTCDLVVGRGTSYSCPLLAGHAALVREYFMSGYYPTGQASLEDGFSPSGALLKAMLVHSAVPLELIVNDDKTTESTERGDFNQGYGRAQLDTVLSFGVNSSLQGLTLFVLGASNSNSAHYAELTYTSEYQEIVFTTADTENLQPIRATLVYTDMYGTIGASKVLINDLDLEIYNSTHSFYPLVTTDSEGKYDRLNTVEVVDISHPVRNAEYTVKVSAHLLVTTQPFALVLSGEVGRVAYETRGGESSSLSSEVTLAVVISIVAAFALACVLYLCSNMFSKKDSQRETYVVHQRSNDYGPTMDDIYRST